MLDSNNTRVTVSNSTGNAGSSRGAQRLLIIESKIGQLIEKKELPYSAHQGSAQHLLSLFEMIRVHRNEAVHPNAGKVTREKIFLSIQTMPEALSVISRLTNWFSSQS